MVDLLGMLAYGELVAFDRVAVDARLAPDLRRRAQLSTMAAAEIDNYRRLVARITELGADPQEAMRPFVDVIDAFHDSTKPRNWLEGLVKAYVGDGIADDFFREVAGLLEPDDRQLVLEVLHSDNEFAVAEITGAIADNPAVANRLALWARRLVGEALSQAQRVAAEHDSLTMLIVQGTGDLTKVGELIKRLMQAHADRMTTVGLNN
ncbi:tRNA-(MS[2]IO[6]A)-hydroxylase MiaE-like protein [Stackebrandtia albiflava]|uniref:tRNA-(MS[2]IO[6]A)-hydroxylase MiaE-like protein n=1 Tax=Stackebrandtia albiflava TaxID=406432 RepID=A0A562V4R0_9ACTN|nr:tRNA-(MS[2]IO[6]A)-hydroxylase MiaE-like protein [Stackebrandtia albiflava]